MRASSKSAAGEGGRASRHHARLREAITGGSIRTTLLVLALPVLGEQLLNSFVAVCDIYLAGRLSKEATAAVGLASYVAWFGSMLFALVGTGTTALVARCAGARQHAEANRFTNQSITLSILCGVTVSAALFLLAPAFARLQGMTGQTYAMAVQYLRIDAMALPMMSIALVGAAALRGAGDTRTPMLVLAVVNILNVIVSVALVYGIGPIPRLGFTGIVLGTAAGRVVGGTLMLVVLSIGRSGLRLRRSALGLQREPVRRVLRIGGPAASDGALMWTGHFVFLMIVGRLATGELQVAYYAAHMIGVRLEALTYLPAAAWAAAAATMIGQNLGARHPDRARRSGHEAVLQCGVLAVLVGLVFLSCAGGLFALLHKDPLVRQVAVGPFRMLACGQPLLAMSIVYVGALRGAGDTRFPVLITVMGNILVRLPAAYVLGVLWQWGLWGVWLAMCGDFVMRAALAAGRFARGRWIHTRV